jgi:hypothetical protein
MPATVPSAFSVATRSASRLRARSAARAGLRQTTRRSPELQVAGLDERPDRGRPQAAHPVDPARLPQPRDPGGGQHPPIADEDDLGKAEPVAELLDLGLDRGRIRGVAREDRDRDRAALRVGHQAEDDLAPVRAMVE